MLTYTQSRQDLWLDLLTDLPGTSLQRPALCPHLIQAERVLGWGRVVGTLWCVYVGRKERGGQLSSNSRCHRPGTQVLVQRAKPERKDTKSPGPHHQAGQHLGKAFPFTPRSQGPEGVNMGEK